MAMNRIENAARRVVQCSEPPFAIERKTPLDGMQGHGYRAPLAVDASLLRHAETWVSG